MISHAGLGDAAAKALRARLRKAELARMRRESLVRVIAAAAVIWLMLNFVFGFMRLGGVTMSPALQDGDLLLYYRLAGGYESGDIVVYSEQDVLYVGRIAAMPSEEVLITEEGTLVINGYYQADTDNTPYAQGSGAGSAITLAEDEYYILLEDRTATLDSRSFGAIKRSDIKGKLITLLRRRGF